ncbi:FERM domain-containing protein 1 isoform X4 [Lissotriton helveticus]
MHMTGQRGRMPEQAQRSVGVIMPDGQEICLAVGVKAYGQELFDKACHAVKIKDPHFFGLSVLQKNEYVYMDLDQKISKYFPKEWKKEISKSSGKFSPCFITFFRVQYYVENGRIISDKAERHLYYCHLKEQVLISQCTQMEEVYFLLAAYRLQADFGDLKKNEPDGRYFEPQAYFPQWIIAKRGIKYILKHAPEMHEELRGLPVKKAVLKFIKESCLLEDVPVHCYRLQKGKKFEIQPDGLPSAQKLVYYTGCPFRSQHLLQLLSNSHRLYLNIQPVLKEIRKMEEAEEKKCYMESYVSDTLAMDFELLVGGGDESSRGSTRNKPMSCQSTVTRGSSPTSGIEPDSRHRLSVEMSVDEPFGNETTHRTDESCSSSISHGSSGIVNYSQWQADGDSLENEVELAVDEPQEMPVDDPLETSQFDEFTEGDSLDFSSLEQGNMQA